MWTRIASIILRYRIFLLIVLSVFTAFMAYHASLVSLDYGFPAMLPETDSTYIQNEKFKEQFGGKTSVVIIGFIDSEFFKYRKFNDWIILTDSLQTIDGVTSTISVSNCYNIIKDKENKKFEVEPVFSSKINSQAEMDSLVKIYNTLPFYKELINNRSDFQILAISLENDVEDSFKRIFVVDEISRMVGNFEKKYNLDIHYSGLPFTRTRIGEIIQNELYLFIFLASIVTAILLLLFFRSFKVVLFSLIIVGTSVVWALGTLYLFGFHLTVLSGMIPPLLIVIGIPNIVFLLNKYHNEYKNHGNKIKSLQRVVSKVGGAIFLTNLTTAAGFATFIITNSRLLVEFGIVAAINIMGIFFISLLLVPIIFSFIAPPKKKQTKHLENKRIKWVINKFCLITKNYRKTLYGFVGVMIVVCIIGISQMKTTGYLVDDISKEDPVYTDLKFFETEINGVIPIEICIDTKKRNGIMNVRFLQNLDELQTRLEKIPELSKSISVANGIKFARQAYYNGKEDQYKLPSQAEVNFILAYMAGNKDKVNILSSFIDSTACKARLSLFVADIGTKRMEELGNSLIREVNSIFPPSNYDTIVTGSCFLYTKGTTYLIKNLFISLGLAIILISIFMALMFSSIRMVIISLIPNILPLLFTAAIMGYFGIAIKPSTLLVFSIAFGISVDNAIHFLAKYGQELKATKQNIGKSVILALKEAGISIIYTGIILFFGFAIFIASKFGGTQALGVLIAITIMLAVFANLLLLPSLLFSIEKIIGRKRSKEE